MILETVGALGSAAGMLANRSSRRRQRRANRKATDKHIEGLEASKTQLGDIQRRQDLAFGDANVGLEGGVLEQRQANLDNDQKFDMDAIIRALSAARSQRSSMTGSDRLADMQEIAGIVGSGAFGLQQLIPPGPSTDAGLGGSGGWLSSLAGMSGSGPLATLLASRRVR